MTPYIGHDSPISAADDVLPLPSFTKAFPHFYEDPYSLPHSIDPFTVNATTGFLPTKVPILDLPDVFKPLQKTLEEMPVTKLDGTPGLLASYRLGPLIDSGRELADLTDQIDKLIVAGTNKHDLHLVTALFRDYSFLASAYLLEPCWQTRNKRQTESEVASPASKCPTSKDRDCPLTV